MANSAISQPVKSNVSRSLHFRVLSPKLHSVPSERRDASAAISMEIGDEGLKEQVKAATSRLERDLIQRALSQTGGNVTHAARLLKISRKGLQLKMKELELRGD